MHPLADRRGRVATDFRASPSDRCNVRCTYCMPAEGLDWLPHENQLSDEDCDRVRLTADGQARNYLFARTESDLRVAMRSGATEAGLAARWLAAMRGKAPATASTTRSSSNPTGRCPRSEADLLITTTPMTDFAAVDPQRVGQR